MKCQTELTSDNETNAVRHLPDGIFKQTSVDARVSHDDASYREAPPGGLNGDARRCRRQR
jgi:hypothetical protein